MSSRIVLFITLFLISSSAQLRGQQIFDRSVELMGCGFRVVVVADHRAEADIWIQAAVNEMDRIEKLISSWDPNSQTSLINKNAGIKPVIVDKELFELIKRAIKISKLTDGAFDITYASMDRIWKFDGSMTEPPSQAAIEKSVSKVGYDHIVLNEELSTVFLPIKGMKIGFGAIGKGYAADEAKKRLLAMGVKAGIINASGDLNAWGQQPDGNPWFVAITNPMNKKNAFAKVPVRDQAVVTSGNYEKFVKFDDIRYAHIMNPKTGYPTTGIISVTIFAPKTELADALATSVFVMGVEVGLDRIDQLPNVEAIIIDKDGDIHTSENIDIDKL